MGLTDLSQIDGDVVVDGHTLDIQRTADGVELAVTDLHAWRGAAVGEVRQRHAAADVCDRAGIAQQKSIVTARAGVGRGDVAADRESAGADGVEVDRFIAGAMDQRDVAANPIARSPGADDGYRIVAAPAVLRVRLPVYVLLFRLMVMVSLAYGAGDDNVANAGVGCRCWPHHP